MSTQQLADAVGALGLEIKRPVLSNLENERRDTVSVAEVLVLATALRVPPIRLLFPLDREVEPLPGHSVLPWTAMRWFGGEDTLLSAGGEQLEDSWAPLTRYRQHQEVLARWRTYRARLSEARGSLHSDPGPWEKEMRDAESWLAVLRAEIREHDGVPPTLPSELGHVVRMSVGPRTSFASSDEEVSP